MNTMRPIAIAAVSVFVAVASRAAEPAKSESVEILVNFFAANGNFAGLAYGIDHGIYAAEGIDLKLVMTPSSVEACKNLIKGGSRRFAYADALAVVKTSTEGEVPLTMIANYNQELASGLVTFADSGVNSIDDLVGKKISFGPTDSSRTLWPAVLKAKGLQRKKFIEVILNGPAKITALVNGNVDAMGGLVTFQGGQVAGAAGDRKEKWLFFSDMGISLLQQGLIIRRADLKDEKMNKRMVRATSAAWMKAGADPDAAVASLVKLFPDAAKIPKAAVKLQWQATFQRLHSRATKHKPPGYMDLKDWERLVDFAKEYGDVEKCAKRQVLFH